MAQAQKQRKGSHKVSNVRRSEHRRNRYRTNLNDRDRAYNRLAREDALTPALAIKQRKVQRMLDNPRKRAGKGKHYVR